MGLLRDIIVIAVIVFFAYILIKLISAPIRWIFKLLLNAVMGFVILFLINFLGSLVGFQLDINPISALVTGIFGFPGVIVLVILKLLT